MNKSLFLKAIFIAVCIASAMQVRAQNHLDWVKGFGSIGVDQGNAIATDTAGNVYTTGSFIGTVDFDPGPGVTALTTPNTSSDVFITKMDAAGHLIWARSVGGSTGKGDAGYGIAVDAAGNVYVTGLFAGKVDFNLSSAVADTFFIKSGVAAGTLYYLNPFVLKLDSAGKFVWAQGWGNAVDGNSTAIALDVKGDNVYVTGKSYGALGGSITRFNASGTLIWTVSPVVSSSAILGKGIAVSKTGNVYVVGNFAFIKLDTAGNLVWANYIGATCNAIAMDAADNVHIDGYFARTGSTPIDFDPGPGVFNFPYNATSSNLFAAKYDSAGAFLWVKAIGELVTGTVANSIATDVARNVYLTGTFTNTIDFDPGAGMYNLSVNNGKTNSFVLKLNSLGDFVWATSYTGQNAGTNTANAIAVNKKDRAVYTTGYFVDSTFFCSPKDTIPLNSIISTGTTRSQDIFIYKMIQVCNTATDFLVTACENYRYNGKTYTASGTYPHAFVNMDGCDSIINLKLTINNPVSTALSANACKSYTLNGQSYTATGIYKQSYTSAGGCDSSVTLNLTIDTALTNVVATSCDSIRLNGQLYTTTGIYKQALISIAGCDSIVTLNLTIGNTPNGSVSKNSNVLTAGVATTYQWVDCNKGKAFIAGATQQTFTPKANGSYAVIMTGSAGCSDTSDCVAVTDIAGVDDLAYNSSFHVFPNPGSHIVYVQSGVPLNSASIRLIDVLGREVMMENNINVSVFTIDLTKYTPGMYVLEITEANKIARTRLVKE